MSEQLGKILIFIGGVLLVSGFVIVFISRFVNLDNLPGTIRIEGGNYKVIIPIAASIILSVFLTIILNIIMRLINR